MAAAWALLGVLGAVVVVPGAGVVVATARAVAADPAGRLELARRAFSASAVGWTVVYSAGIGLAAALLAMPAAWVIGLRPADVRGRRRAVLWTAGVIAPLLLPSYLVYAGWGNLRGPGTALGDWLARAHPSWSILAGRATAVLGMALWAWPLAALVQAGVIRGLGSGVLDLARMEAPGSLKRLGLMLGATWRGAAAGAAVVGLVICGSAIPLHVAQAPTYAITLWQAMQLSPDTAGVWMAAAPLLVLAAGGAVVIQRVVACRLVRPEQTEAGGRAGVGTRVGAGLVWGAAVIAPIVLFALSIRDWRSVGMFWRLSGEGVAQSLRIAGATGAAGAALALVTWAALDLGGRMGRWAAWVGGAGFLFAGLMPGVLVGAAMGGVWGSGIGAGLARVLGDVPVVTAHLARFGFVGVLGGWWLAALEPREQRWLRSLDAGGSVGAWIRVTAWPQAGVVAGLGLAVMALSMHEIESTVFVLQPGAANLAQQLLDYLHYARDEQLSAAAVNLLGIGSVAALGAGWLLARAVVGSGAGAVNLQRGQGQ